MSSLGFYNDEHIFVSRKYRNINRVPLINSRGLLAPDVKQYVTDWFKFFSVSKQDALQYLKEQKELKNSQRD